MRKGLIGLLLGAVFVAVAAGESRATEPLPLDIGGDFTLVDQRGQTRDSSEFRGRLTLIWFGYTECPHSCPMALSAMSAALDLLGQEAGAVVPLFVTVDPDHDTPARMTTHLANFHPAFVGLTGSRNDIAKLQTDYRTSTRKVADPGQFTRLFEHGTLIYLMGRGGEPLSLLPATLPPERIAAILRGYL
ncbi:MAG: SCO family protein [Alphaproteobacteria bacterium]|nr:SCO family protein [Alphaproteobacteria bacterium]